MSKLGSWRSQIDGSQATHPYLQGNCALVADSRKIWDERLKLEKLVPAIGTRGFFASALFCLRYKLSFLKYSELNLNLMSYSALRKSDMTP